MKPGQWSLRFSQDTPKSVLDKLNWQVTATAGFGHVCIFPTRLNPKLYSTAQLLSLSRYTGVLREWTDEFTVGGPGPAFWLGDENAAGDLLETAVGYSASTLSTWVGGLRPVSLNAGSVAGIGSHTGSYQWVTRRAALDAVCAAIGAEWKITPALALDANTAANLWPDTDVVITRRAESRDIVITGLRTTRITSGIDLIDYTTKVRTSSKAGIGSATTSTAFKDINGNTVELVRYVETPEAEDANAAATAILGSVLSARKNVQLSSDVYDIRRDLEPGQWVYVYDPDIGLVDSTYKIQYAGQHITPARLRVHSITWPVQEGMGVAFRDGDGNWTDLTDWIEWESGDTTLDVGGYARTALGSVGASGTPQLAAPTDDGRWVDYAPQFDQTTVGIAYTKNSARWRRIGTTIHVEVDVAFTGSGTAGGVITMTVPVDFAHASIGHKGSAFFYDTSASTTYKPAVIRSNTAKVAFKESSTDLLGAIPNFGIASGDLLTCSLMYEGVFT
jgi:hypothetical protein